MALPSVDGGFMAGIRESPHRVNTDRPMRMSPRSFQNKTGITSALSFFINQYITSRYSRDLSSLFIINGSTDFMDDTRR
jgi:hypothetical protein